MRSVKECDKTLGRVRALKRQESNTQKMTSDIAFKFWLSSLIWKQQNRRILSQARSVKEANIKFTLTYSNFKIEMMKYSCQFNTVHEFMKLSTY